MKQTIIVLTILAVGLAAFGLVGSANAQVEPPLYPGNGGNGNGRGPAAGGGTGVPMEQNINLASLMDDAMAAYIANGLGISVDELKAREAAGETLVAIGLSLGFDAESALALHTQARIEALTQAVANGLITQVQADWMLSRLDAGQFAAGTGAPAQTQSGRMNRSGNQGACLYTTP